MAFDITVLKELCIRNMAKVFASLPGEKVALVHPTLLQPLDRVANMTVLRQMNVKKVFKIADRPPDASLTRLVYLIPPTYDATMTIITHCEVDQTNSIHRNKLVVFIPVMTVAMRYLLECRGLCGHSMSATSLSLGWISLDTDLLTINLPDLYSDFYLYGDTKWLHYIGQQVGQLLDLACQSELAPLGCRVHAFGRAAEVVASGLRLYCVQAGLGMWMNDRTGFRSSQISSRKQACNSSDSSDQTKFTGSPLCPPPVVLLFSRDLDYVTPFLIPMTFEALIHEIIGIQLGWVELPQKYADNGLPRKMLLNSSNVPYFKAVRDTHISCVHTVLLQLRAGLQDARVDLEFGLANAAAAEMDQTSKSHDLAVGTDSHLADLTQIGMQLAPMLASRRDIAFLFVCLQQIMQAMTQCERVEDLRDAQTNLLLSGSGGALPVPTDSSANDEVVKQTTGGVTWSAADEINSQPIRLAIEWMSTNHGDRLTDGLRLLCLACATHDGLGEELYSTMHRLILHTAGQISLPMLHALRLLRLLAPRSVFLQTTSSSAHLLKESNATSPTPIERVGVVGAKTGAALSAAASKLGLPKRRKSTYNRLHHLLRLSHSIQAHRSVEQSPLSPAYVFAGQHTPVVVRLAEAIWSLASSEPGSKSPPLSANSSTQQQREDEEQSNAASFQTSDSECVSKTQLLDALQRLGLEPSAVSSLGLISLFDQKLATAGHQRESLACMGQLSAPLPRPLPVRSTDHPILVVFPGGCTYGEVAALRFVAARRRWQLLIATSCLLTSRDLLHQTGQAAMMINRT